MKKRHSHIWITTVLILSISLSVYKFTSAQAQKSAVDRGKYLVENVAACGYCHTPRKGAEPDTTRLLAGHPEDAPYPVFSMQIMAQNRGFMLTAPTLTAFAGPYGVSFAGNLTPDKETGLGKWTEDMFLGFMRTGKHPGHNGHAPRDVLPPMPWKHYKAMSDEDLKAIWAYLKSLPPVKNHVPHALRPDGRPY